MKLGLQLYNFRKELKADFKGTLREIAKLGFDGVEFAGDYGTCSRVNWLIFSRNCTWNARGLCSRRRICSTRKESAMNMPALSSRLQ